MTARRRLVLAWGWFCYQLYVHWLPWRIAKGPLGMALLPFVGDWAYADVPPFNPADDDGEPPF